MSTPTRSKLHSFTLVGSVLAAGLMAQGAVADFEPNDEIHDAAGQKSRLGTAEPPGPQGEALFRNPLRAPIKAERFHGRVVKLQSVTDEPG